MKPKIVSLIVLTLILTFAVVAGTVSLLPAGPAAMDGKFAEPSPAATIAQIDLSKLRVSKISRVELGCSGAAEIAPDSQHYVCSGGPDNPGLWLGSIGKGLEKRLAETGGPAAWLPNSRDIVYAEAARDQQAVLYEQDIDTGSRTPLSSPANPYKGHHLQVLPNGVIVDSAYDTFGASDSQSEPLKSLQKVGCVDAKMQWVVLPAYSIFSPDGRRGAEACAGLLYMTDIRTGKSTILSDNAGIYVNPMAWSPDASQLAYSVQPETDRHAELWLVSADGSNPRRLLRDEQARAFEWLTWMADGQTLLFMKNPGGSSFGPGCVYMAIDSKGGPPNELFRNGESLQLFDGGRKILISRSVEESGDWIVDLAW